jgi:hypothetical protein
MLRWKPANIRDAVLQMQQAIALYRTEVGWRQCHYYVTEEDIAAELGTTAEVLTGDEIDSVLGGLGLRLDKEVYSISLHSENTTGYFAPEAALKREGISLPEWNLPPRRRGRPRYSAHLSTEASNTHRE